MFSVLLIAGEVIAYFRGWTPYIRVINLVCGRLPRQPARSLYPAAVFPIDSIMAWVAIRRLFSEEGIRLLMHDVLLLQTSFDEASHRS